MDTSLCYPRRHRYLACGAVVTSLLFAAPAHVFAKR